jgi:low temperature requirement protein LtrA
LLPPEAGAQPAREHGERHASWLELFFDLVFVVAIAQLARQLVDDHSLGGFAIFAGLFLPVFIAWQGYTFYADRFDTDDAPFRVVMLAAMLAIAALAVQLPDVAAGRHDTGFVLAYVALRSLLICLYLRAWRAVPRARPLIGRYAGGYSVGVAIWLASLLVDPPLRYVLWGIGLAIEYAMPVVAQRYHRYLPVDPAHVPERFALFTIIVLGESVVAVALGTAATDWRLASSTAAVLGFAAVACIWWLYFGEGIAGGLSSETGSMQIFTRAHIPLLGALTAVGAGVHMLIEEAPGATSRRGLPGRSMGAPPSTCCVSRCASV